MSTLSFVEPIVAAGEDQQMNIRHHDLIPMGHAMTEEHITKMLTQAAYSVAVRAIRGLTRYDGAQLLTKLPCEDRFIHSQFPLHHQGGKSWMAWGIFDGHAGPQTAELLEARLLSVVQEHLARAISGVSGQPAADTSIQQAIADAFIELDDAIVKPAAAVAQSSLSFAEKRQRLAYAFAGSCALLSLYDPVTSKVHVACTGDSRAVLGQQSADGRWNAKALSVDQDAKNEEEVARVKSEHPGEEENIVADGRILGFAVSRAFGDGRLKWPAQLSKELYGHFYSSSELPGTVIKTPPYLTAQPAVTWTEIDLDHASFLISASDGFWATVSSEEAVELVAAWLAFRKAGAEDPPPPPPSGASFNFGDSWGEWWYFEQERTVVQDDNAAVHLIRNALGGYHVELLAGRLALGPPMSDNIRDDITVQVVFFNLPAADG